MDELENARDRIHAATENLEGSRSATSVDGDKKEDNNHHDVSKIHALQRTATETLVHKLLKPIEVQAQEGLSKGVRTRAKDVLTDARERGLIT